MSNEKDPLKSSLKNAKDAMDEARKKTSDAVDAAKDKLKQMSADIKKDQQGKEK